VKLCLASFNSTNAMTLGDLFLTVVALSTVVLSATYGLLFAYYICRDIVKAKERRKAYLQCMKEDALRRYEERYENDMRNTDVNPSNPSTSTER